MNSGIKNCQKCKGDFVIEVEDFVFYKKLKVPPPTWCPRCRFLRRMTFMNERSLYKKNCDFCKTSMITMYRPDEIIKVLCEDCYSSDNWSGSDYGRDYDFSRNFFEQFKELRNSVPHRALDKNTRNGPGCEYSNFCFDSKEAYLSFGIYGGENIKYSKNIYKFSKNCVDCLIIKKNEYCYESVQSGYCYESSFLVESEQCISSSFLYDCLNCINCTLSSNLRNKSYVFKNKQLTKEEYLEAVNSLKLNTYRGQVEVKKYFEEMVKKAIHKYAHIKNCVNSTGDFLENSKNCLNCYGLASAENLKNCFLCMSVPKSSQDLVFVGRSEECYEIVHGGKGINHVVLGYRCGNGSRELIYCDNCRNCVNCFGCSGLEGKEFCIFNKQYEKEEYFKLVEKIKSHMDEISYIDKVGRKYGFGEYFPSEISPFAYNETLTYEEENLSKEEVLAQGYRWLDKDQKIYDTTIETEKMPDDINDVGEEICREIIACPNKGKVDTRCTYGFRILPDELVFYKKMNLPIPRYCPNCRYYERLQWTNRFKFYKRECMCELENHNHNGKCKVEFETMYAPDREELIYCKDCYQKEVY